jgi:hypothetical protein
MGVHKFRRSPKRAHQALESLLDMREDASFAQGDPQAIEQAAHAAFEAEVAMQALAGRGSLPRSIRAELHQASTARREQMQPAMSVVLDASGVELA